MILRNVLEIIDRQEYSFRFDKSEFSECDGLCSVNDLIPLPVIISTSIQSDLDMDVNDENNLMLGRLCCCKLLGEINPNELTDAKYAAYINEVSPYSLTDVFTFTKDYFVVEARRYDEYKTKYMQTAPMWGGFIHETGTYPLPDSYQKGNLTSITALPNINLPTDHHKYTIAKSVLQPYGFERFLKLYHMLELLFDYDLVKDIQGLSEDLRGIGKLLANYEREELDRLKSLLRKRCDYDIDRIAELLNNIKNQPEYIDKGKEIFFLYGKEGNPFKAENETKFDELMNGTGFTRENANRLKLLNKDRTYERLIIDTAAYWIYRIRCCVVHQRIGEYVMTDDDEEFIVEVIEPLIRGLLLQAFRQTR